MADIGWHPGSPDQDANDNVGGAATIYAQGPYTPSGAGTLTELHFYSCYPNSQTFRYAIYGNSGTGTSQVPGALLYSSAEQTAGPDYASRWENLTGLSVALSGAPIWLAMFFNSAGDLGYYFLTPGVNAAHGGDSNWGYWHTQTYTQAGALPDPFGAGSTSAQQYAIYGVYTPSATGGQVSTVVTFGAVIDGTAGTPGPTNITPPSVTGTAQVGQTLTCDPGEWTV